MKRKSSIILAAFAFGVFATDESDSQLLEIPRQSRTSRVSNFEFQVFNDGTLYGTMAAFEQRNRFVDYWPRGTNHMWFNGGRGLAFLAKKQGKLLYSQTGFLKYLDAICWANDFVPGRIGDQHAGYDSVFSGAGWRFVDDGDYIVYSSLDFDSNGVDVSGANYNDWPVRIVGGLREYVPDPLERHLSHPAFVSDEDMFFVTKDTETRVDPLFSGPDGPSTPIGVEVQTSIFTWSTGPLHNVVVFQYDILNKSSSVLDSCFVVFGSGLDLGKGPPNFVTLNSVVRAYSAQPWRNLAYVRPTNPAEWPLGWTATPIPPTQGYCLLETPTGYDGLPLGLRRASAYLDFAHLNDTTNIGNAVDSVAYRVLSSTTGPGIDPRYPYGTAIMSGPFKMTPGQSARASVAMTFSDSLPHLLLLDDLIKRMYANGYERPSAPPAPHLTVTGLNRAVKLTWDNNAEQSHDIIIPDSLGRSFIGYRLLRASAEEGPYLEIGRWVVDSLVVHEYLDRGEDLAGGLKNNKRYYYQLLAFDEGARSIKLEPLESKPVMGVNWQSIIPATVAANEVSFSSTGELSAGTLGDLNAPMLVPIDATNFNVFFSGRPISVTINAASDGVEYTMPVTVRDTIGGRTYHAIVDPDVLVHGSPGIAGIKEGTAVLRDIFGIGGADISMHYRFEQLADSLRVVPDIESPQGADVPIIIRDSLSVTGLQFSSPYTSKAQEVILEFTPGGFDTVSNFFQRYFPYLNIAVTDASTGQPYQGDWRVAGRAARQQGGTAPTLRTNRYYLTGPISNGETWDFGHLVSIYNWAIALDFPDRGQGSGKVPPLFPWASQHRSGTQDFRVGNRVHLTWQGGVRGEFPRDAVITIIGAAPGRAGVTEAMMEGIRIVPNPYLIRHEAQTSERRIYFNYLPDECTIRIYTLALDLVRTLHHDGGSREEWDLMTERGQLVASQMLFAHVESQGKNVIKKFAVIVGK